MEIELTMDDLTVEENETMDTVECFAEALPTLQVKINQICIHKFLILSSKNYTIVNFIIIGYIAFGFKTKIKYRKRNEKLKVGWCLFNKCNLYNN